VTQNTIETAQIERLAQSVRSIGKQKGSANLGRLVRVIRLLHLLCSSPGLTSTQLSQQLDISRRTLYRDFKLLRTAGIAIESRICSQDKRLSGYHIGWQSEDELDLGKDMTSLAILASLTRHPILNELDPYVQMAREAVDSIVNNLAEDNRAFCQSVSEEFYTRELQRVIQLMAEASHSTVGR